MSRRKRTSIFRVENPSGKGGDRNIPEGDGRRRLLLLPFLVFVASLLPFLGTIGNGFVDFDDDFYVTANPVVARGLTLPSVAWAFTTFDVSNWHPLTWLSHMADVTLFGLDPAGHHAVNVLLHGTNALLLFLFLRRATGREWAAALAALLFALHPLRVEVVAWVSERKELLCTLFQLLGFHAYLAYARTPGWRRYLPVPAFLSLALLSKPMAVTFPFVLLLLDYWPLGRVGSAEGGEGQVLPHSTFPRLVLEKAPLLIPVLLSCAVTLRAQGAGSSVLPLSLPVRIGNAFTAATSYLGKTVLPANLSIFYPHPGTLDTGKAAASALLLAALTVLAVHQRGKRPFLLAGWLFFLGTLVPVLGLVQVGTQAMADRYTYLPHIGLFAALAWAVPSSLFPGSPVPLPNSLPSPQPLKRDPLHVAFLCMTALLLVGLGSASFLRAREWQSSKTLFAAGVRVNPKDWYSWEGLAWDAAYREGDLAKGIALYARAVEAMPYDQELRYNYGVALMKAGDAGAAEIQYRAAVRIRPEYVAAWEEYGRSMYLLGRKGEAVTAWNEALRLDPARERTRRFLTGVAGVPPVPLREER